MYAEGKVEEATYNLVPFVIGVSLVWFFRRRNKLKLRKKIKEKWQTDHAFWQFEKQEAERDKIIEEQYTEEKKNAEEQYAKESRLYKELYENYLASNPIYISTYVSSVIDENHLIFDFIECEVEADYNPENRIIVVDCMLPSPADMPTLKEVIYVKSKGENKDVHLSQKEINDLYDDVIYKLCLSDINQIFLTDEINAIDGVVFNGWVNSLDKATGQYAVACILSVQVSKEKFSQINLMNVDPKECFRGLRGVGSSKLHGITPIPPMMRTNKEDSRFIEAHDVAHTLSEGSNLAAMDWQEFEHLVREIFSKMFSGEGAEVKVTQSSKDRGVDAIAFDPDPVRGGKIVIQAKRYTNVVGVSAVRDLYGTVMNEGAMKGILVTTSHFGNDAYEFAQGKPLTLISGGELLSLLANHGYKARIDLQEAKRILGEKEVRLRIVE